MKNGNRTWHEFDSLNGLESLLNGSGGFFIFASSPENSKGLNRGNGRPSLYLKK